MEKSIANGNAACSPASSSSSSSSSLRLKHADNQRQEEEKEEGDFGIPKSNIAALDVPIRADSRSSPGMYDSLLPPLSFGRFRISAPSLRLIHLIAASSI